MNTDLLQGKSRAHAHPKNCEVESGKRCDRRSTGVQTTMEVEYCLEKHMIARVKKWVSSISTVSGHDAGQGNAVLQHLWKMDENEGLSIRYPLVI